MRIKKILNLFLIVTILGLPVFQNTVKSAPKKKNVEYHIKVNRRTNIVTVYRKEGKELIPIRAMLCSSGGKLTPLGTFRTLQKYRWRKLFFRVYGQYSTRITENVLFHSIPYYRKNEGTMMKGQYERLGTKASHGCVRLAANDAKWIYDNCRLGTKVTVYESNDRGPLDVPKLKPYTGKGYDPTDIWAFNEGRRSKKPVLKVPKKINLTCDDFEYDFFKKVKGTNAYGDDITGDVEIDEDVDFDTPGKYIVKYTLVDELGNKTSARSTVVIKEAVKEKEKKTLNEDEFDDDTVNESDNEEE